MYFDLPFCIKNIKSVTQNIENPLHTNGYTFKKVKIQFVERVKYFDLPLCVKNIREPKKCNTKCWELDFQTFCVYLLREGERGG